MYASSFPTATRQTETVSERRRQAHLRAVARPAIETRVDAPLTVRFLSRGDSARLERLAGRDSSPVPAGRVLGAEVDGALVAAVSLEDGKILADPFRSTRAAVELLRLRLGQLRGARHRRFALLRR